jgi:addiction module RelE/StbE family toxin
MARVVWTFQSANDLENIFHYISKDSFKYARIQIERIRDCVKNIKIYPKSGRIVPEVRNEQLREVISGNYRIIYRLGVDDLIEIITIHHSAKQLNLD